MSGGSAGPGSSDACRDRKAFEDLQIRLFEPPVLKLALLQALQKDGRNVTTMHNLDTFANTLTFEKKQIVLDEMGLSLSRSLYIPYEVMDGDLLHRCNALMQSTTSRCLFVNTEKRESVVFELDDDEILGVVNIICAFFLIMHDASLLSKKHTGDSCTADGILSVFDVLLKSICFKQRVDYQNIMKQCITHGYGDISTLAPH